MSNSGIITNKEKQVAVYLHWNGGRDSVEAFLKYCELAKFRSPDTQNYGWARLCQVIANFMGPDGLSVGVDKYENFNGWYIDHGVYIIEGWKIVGREDFKGEEQQEYSLAEMLMEIDERQPTNQQIFKVMGVHEVEKLLEDKDTSN